MNPNTRHNDHVLRKTWKTKRVVARNNMGQEKWDKLTEKQKARLAGET